MSRLGKKSPKGTRKSGSWVQMEGAETSFKIVGDLKKAHVSNNENTGR